MPENETVELIDYIRVIFKRKRLIITGFIIAVVVAAVVSFLLPPVYQSLAVLEIGRIDENLISSVESTSEMLKAPSIQRGMVEKLNIKPEASELTGKIDIRGKGKSNLVIVTARANKPQIAKEIANYLAKTALLRDKEKYLEVKNVVESYVGKLEKAIAKTERKIQGKEERISQIDASSEAGVRELRVHLEAISSLEERIDDLQGKVEESRFKISTTMRPTRIIRPARESEYPIAPRKKVNVVIAGLLALFILVPLTLFLEYWGKANPRLRKKD